MLILIERMRRNANIIRKESLPIKNENVIWCKFVAKGN